MAFIKPYREKPPKPAREINCVRCGCKFYTRRSGNPKYCIECGDIIYYENQRK